MWHSAGEKAGSQGQIGAKEEESRGGDKEAHAAVDEIDVRE